MSGNLCDEFDRHIDASERLSNHVGRGGGRRSPGAASPGRGGKGLGREDVGRGRSASPPSHGSSRTARPVYGDNVVELNSVFESCEASRSDDVPPHERAQNEMQMALSRVPKQLFDSGIMLML